MRISTLALAVALATAPAAVFAAEGTAAGIAGGAATGAVLGGPVGAVAGGVAGGVIGTLASPPERVKTYVVQEQRPSVVYEGDVVVGKPVPQTVEVYRVPDSDYSYTVINQKRYIVDSDRNVVQVVD